jgi:hypothetical protein
MDDLIKGYLDSSHEILGDRVPGEMAYDNEIVKQLGKGRDIKKALKMAARKYPSEALQWNEENIGDIAAHYEYLMEHEEMTRKLSAPAGSGSRKQIGSNGDGIYIRRR